MTSGGNGVTAGSDGCGCGLILGLIAGALVCLFGLPVLAFVGGNF